MQHDISNLMIGRWSNRKNENEVKEAPKLPLLLSQVMEGRPITSQSFFLALPPEILAEIMALVADDKATLSSLALVNSDCRQLARSYQFIDVCFDYSPRSRKLLDRLLDEAQVRADTTSGTANRLFIGSCIRRVRVQPTPRHVAAAHKDLWEAIWGEPELFQDREKVDDLRNKAAYDYLMKYRFPILQALEQAMPHLDSLLWYDEMCLDIEAFKTLARLPLQNIKFSGAYVGAPLSLEPPVVPQNIPLQSLSLGVSPCTEEMHARGVAGNSNPKKTAKLSSFISSYLMRCCGTLESFTIKASGSKAEKFWGHDTMVFPHLRYLDLASGTSYPDQAAWSSFLAAPLRHLSLPLNGLNKSRRYMSNCPTLKHLETLVVPSLSMGTELAQLVVDFVLQHSHVRKLSVQNSTPQLLDQRILPALAGGKWSNLTSLSLSWRDPEVTTPSNPNDAQISPEALAAINSIKSLEQLCLSAGESAGWRHHWLPNHNDLRLRLQDLENLQKLAFSRDTYKIPDEIPFRDMESYYDDRWVTQTEHDDATARPHLDPVERGRLSPAYSYGVQVTDLGDGYVADNYSFEDEDGDDGSDVVSADIDNLVPNDKIWERAHRNRMLWEAEQYAVVLPKLNWVFCGQLPMSVKATEGAEEKIFEATPLSQQRDPFCKILRPIFEMKGDD